MNTGDRWQQIQNLFAEGLKIPTSERAAWLESRCGDDAALHVEVSSLLAGMDDTQGDLLEKAVRGGHELLDAATSKDHIGTYEILGKIGQGGFGKVYLGFDPLLKRKVAVKTCTTDNEELRRRFRREGEIAARLQHPNITTIFELGLENGVPFLAQEFLTGHDLNEMVARLDTRAKVDILSQVARGLEYAHGQGVLHRDIKPSNLRVLSTGAVKIMDFGIARLLTGADTRLTGTGMTIGTVGYLAPEQLKGGEIDSRADVFSFGVLAYELFAGIRPFVGETFSQVSYQLLYEEPTPLENMWPECPDRRLLEVVKNCLEKDVDQRLKSMGVVAEVLESVVAALPDSPPSDPTIAMPNPGLVADTEELAPTLLDVPSSQELTRLEVDEAPDSTFRERGVEEARNATLPRPTPRALWKQLAGATLVLLVVAITAWNVLDDGSDKPGTVPAKTVPAKTVPAETVPAETVPAETVPVKNLTEEIPPSSRPITTEDGVALAENQPPADETSAPLAASNTSETDAIGAPPPVAPPTEAPSTKSTTLAGATPPPNQGGALEPDVLSGKAGSSVESQPIESQLAESQLAESQLVKSQLAESQLVKSQLIERQPIESQPVEDLTVQNPPVEPSEANPSSPRPLPAPPARAMKMGDHIDASEPGVVAPVPITKVAPVYPPRARRRRVEAHVVVAVYVDENGQVINKSLSLPDKSNYGFNLAAIDAAVKTKFRPATRDGIPGKMWTEIPFEFQFRHR